MAVHEDGEVEVVLGNKQLFSVLFVFVVLLGIFFALGFLAGRSTGPEPAAVASNTSQQGDSVQPPPSTPVVEPDPQPSRQVLPLVTEEPPKAAPQKEAPPVPASKPDAAALAAPPAGKYLQVAASERRADAEGFLAMLRKEGFNGVVTPSRRFPSMTAVLVGPFPTREAIADAREKLKKLNIDKPFAVEYQ